MCGVVGLLNLAGRPESPALVQRMADALAHRGPDGEGLWADGPAILGHRRLSIIDLSPAGRQPMVTPDGRFALTYNGEIYNFRELRTELEAKGAQFHSRTDSEVALHAFAAWGPAAFGRFNGMFALAIWDRRERALWLARDRFGVKPLYYAMAGGSLLFASEVKAFLEHPDFAARMDPAALAEYFTFQNLYTDRTLFEGVRMLPAGAWLKVAADAREPPAPTRYWDYRFAEEERHGDDGAWVEELDRLFRQAVNRQLVSDVEVGAYLSGGIDSGSIVSVAARALPELKTFTVGFDLTSASGIEIGFDERAAAERMSYLFGTEHYEMVLKAGDMERCMSRLVWHLEDPRVGQCYPNFYAARLAGKFGKVVLSGSGGDELFGGYPWRYYRAAASQDFESYVDKYYAYWQRLIPPDRFDGVFRPLAARGGRLDTRAVFHDVFRAHAAELRRPEDYVNHSLYFECRTFLHGLLVVEDKLSMAHGLETRVPFLDNDLVDFAMRCPVRLKLGNLEEAVRFNENDPGASLQSRFQKARDGKLIFRKAMAESLPEEIWAREKQGFSSPDASWFRGESIDYVRDRLMRPGAGVYDFLDRGAVTALVNDHLEGRENRRLLIWSLLCVEEWCDQFLKPRPRAASRTPIREDAPHAQ